MNYNIELFTVIASWPSIRESHWKTLLKARAIENQCYVLGVNRIGEDPYTKYNGGSMIIAPTGEVIASLDSKRRRFSRNSLRFLAKFAKISLFK